MQEASDEEKDCGTEKRVLKVDLGPVLVEQLLVPEVGIELRSDSGMSICVQHWDDLEPWI